jgi:hypothetical protein
MANYAISDYQLRFIMEEGALYLQVLQNDDEVVESISLMSTESAVTLSVSDDEYVIGTGTAVSDNENPHKHQFGGSNTMTYAATTLAGVGIMNLRDMGRSGSLTVIYHLDCCEIRINGRSGTYPLWIKAADLDCVTVIPEEE